MNNLEATEFFRNMSSKIADELNKLSIQDKLTKIFASENAQNIVVITVGKAAEFLYSEIEQIFDDSITQALILSPYPVQRNASEIVEIFQTNHPIPGSKSLEATERLIHILDSCRPKTLVIFGISGGSSASLALPKSGLSLDDLSDLNTFLMRAGLPISSMNLLRTAVSDVKGGQLLSFLPSKVEYVGLYISDVPGDDISVIGSGPTVPNKITKAQILDIIDSVEGFPKDIEHFVKQSFDALDTTSFPDNNHLVLSPKIFAQQVSTVLEKLGLKTRKLHEMEGNVEVVSNSVVDNLPEKGQVDIYFGETTVDVLGNGKGGRNQELALRLGHKFHQQSKNNTAVCFGTDGVDGPTDAAGAWCNSQLIAQALEKDLHADDFLQNSDSYTFFQKLGSGHILTGPTGHNLMDILIVF